MGNHRAAQENGLWKVKEGNDLERRKDQIVGGAVSVQ